MDAHVPQRQAGAGLMLLNAAEAAPGAAAPFWRDALATRRRRIATFFLLYVAEGIPLGFAGGLIATQMRRQGLDPAVIGAFVASLFLPWAFKWAFGPLIDTLGWKRFGRRRSWIAGMQIGMIITLLLAMQVDFVRALGVFTALIVVHNLFAAAQDVAIDALAIQVLHADERGAASGFMFAGQGIGQAIGGPGMLLALSVISLQMAFLVVAAMMAVILLWVCLGLREPPIAAPPWQAASAARGATRRIGRELVAFTRAAAGAFVASRRALLGVLLALLPLGAYSLALSLGSNLAVELGLSDAQIGTLGLAASALSAAGCIVGGHLSDRFGRRSMLAVAIVLMALPTLALAWLMQSAGHVMPVDPDKAVPNAQLLAGFVVVSLVYSLVQGLSYGASTALYMDITTPAVAATQFTAYMALSNLATSYTALWQGLSISRFGYPGTLLLDVLIGMAPLLLLPWMATRRR
jgi:MFS transporter, PAT family, beta-lactamase induction signal transducer AmpG